MKYPVSLALFDYVAVVFNLFGQLLLLSALQIDPVSMWVMALLGVILMNLGGILKASWKLIIAASERDFRWMEHALFLGLAPGSCLLAWAIWDTQRVMSGASSNDGWLACLLIIAVFLAWSARRVGAGGKWFMPLVLLLTVSMGVINVNASLIAHQLGANLAAALFILSFGISLVTSAVSRKLATIKLQWLMETANALSAFCFLSAAWMLQ